ncbi:MAG: nucleotidyltransferase family protein [Chitinophagaceae bacterium]|nr:nucleotidyltransferase family protein [Chitinophagaceae bacterium]
MPIAQLPLQVQQNIDLPLTEIGKFCDRWQIVEFALFGSVLRDDFRPDSDIDVLYIFSDQATHTLFDVVKMQEELQAIFGRKVDLISRKGIEASRNYLRKQNILSRAVIIYGKRDKLSA